MRLNARHPRAAFRSGRDEVDRWLASMALQHQRKHLSTTKVLSAADGEIVGYYTLATGQVDFGDLPLEIVRKLPRRALPIAVVAWLGVARRHQRAGVGTRLLAQALRDCYEAGRTFAFIAVVLDCLDVAAKTFYRRFDFDEVPGCANRLFLGAARLEGMMEGR